MINSHASFRLSVVVLHISWHRPLSEIAPYSRQLGVASLVPLEIKSSASRRGLCNRTYRRFLEGGSGGGCLLEGGAGEAAFSRGERGRSSSTDTFRAGRLDAYKNIYFLRFGCPPDPLRTSLPGPGIGPQGPRTRSTGHPEQFPDQHKVEETRIQKYPRHPARKVSVEERQFDSFSAARRHTPCSKSESKTLKPTTYLRSAVRCTVPRYRPCAQLLYNVVSRPMKDSSL